MNVDLIEVNKPRARTAEEVKKDNLASLSNWQLWRSQLAAAHGVNIYTANQWENITLESKRHATESAP